MCLGIPGKILTKTEDALPMGRVDFGGVVKDVCLAYVPEATLGDYVIVHAGFAITRLAEGEAARTLALLREMGSPPEEEPR